MAGATRVGFIGLGGMGSRMAANVLAGGYELTVYNRTRDKARGLEERGASVGASPRDVAVHSDVIITMLSDPDAVRAALDGAEGILAAAREGLVFVDMSTVGPADARAAVAQAGARGVHVLHAPVVGSPVAAERGELVVLAGGDGELVEAQRPLLQTMGKTIHHMGANEQACAAKLAVNAVLVGSLQLFGEAIALATRWGIPRERALEVIGGGPAVSPAVKARIGTMYAPDAPVNFALRLARKDLNLAVQAAYGADAGVPLIAAALETFTLALKSYGAEDVGRIAAFIGEAGA